MIRFIDPELARWIRPREIPPRTEGRHVSEVVLGMLQRVSPYFRTWGKSGGKKAKWEAGYLWEDVLSEALRGRRYYETGTILAPRELALDAVYGTPDVMVWDVERRRFIVEENKATWFSCREIQHSAEQILDVPKFKYWLLQYKCYAAMLHHLGPELMPGVPIAAPPLARLRALFINGDYSHSKDASDDPVKPLCWEQEFTAAELETFWASVLEHVRDTTQENPTDGKAEPATAAEPPPF